MVSGGGAKGTTDGIVHGIRPARVQHGVRPTKSADVWSVGAEPKVVRSMVYGSSLHKCDVL